MQRYLAKDWEQILQVNGLREFEDFWNLQAPLVDVPNHGRGGWSEVFCLQLKSPNDDNLPVYIKRQSNYRCRSLRHPINGMLTLAREAENLLKFQELEIECPETIYFQQRRKNGDRQAILAVRALEGFEPIHELFGAPGRVSLIKKRRIVAAIAGKVRAMHDKGIKHGCLYPKHIFVKVADDESKGVAVRFIDLENAKRSILSISAMLVDLRRLVWNAPIWSRADKVHFFRCYHGVGRLDKRTKRLWRFGAAMINARRFFKLNRKRLRKRPYDEKEHAAGIETIATAGMPTETKVPQKNGD